jgi:hypothetical protein
MGRAGRLLLRIVAVLATVGVAALVGVVWWGSSLYESRHTDTAHASAAFAEVRARYAGIGPVFAIQETRLVVAREPAVVSSPTVPAAAVHLLIWQPREQMLSRASLPLWMSSIATEPLPLEALAGIGQRGLGAVMEAKHRGNELNVRLSDLKRYGRTLLLDRVTQTGSTLSCGTNE